MLLFRGGEGADDGCRPGGGAEPGGPAAAGQPGEAAHHVPGVGAGQVPQAPAPQHRGHIELCVVMQGWCFFRKFEHF